MTTIKKKKNVKTEESTIQSPNNKNDDPDTDHIHKENNNNNNNNNSSSTKIKSSSPSNGKQILNFLSSDADSITDSKDSKLVSGNKENDKANHNDNDNDNDNNNNDNSSRASSGKSKSSLLSKVSSTWRSVKR